MGSGNYREKLIIQKKTAAQNFYGEETLSWSQSGLIWAAIRTLTSREKLQAQQVESSASYEVKTYKTSLINPECRFLRKRNKTALAAAITSTTATAITVDADLNVSASNEFRIMVDSEIMVVTAGHGTTGYTVTRGMDGTTKDTHAINADVWYMQMIEIESVTDADNMNRETVCLCSVNNNG